jgi:hypothetical protein
MAFFEIFRFFRQAGKLAPLDRSAVRATGTAGEKHATYHRQIVLTGAACGVLGLVPAGILMTAMSNEAGGELSVHDLAALIAVPLGAVAVGFCLGVALACLFAPASFLTGPVGRKWMRFIGARSVLSARVVCFFVVLVLGLVPVIVGLIALFPPPSP